MAWARCGAMGTLALDDPTMFSLVEASGWALHPLHPIITADCPWALTLGRAAIL